MEPLLTLTTAAVTSGRPRAMRLASCFGTRCVPAVSNPVILQVPTFIVFVQFFKFHFGKLLGVACVEVS
eukprot:g8222.t1